MNAVTSFARARLVAALLCGGALSAGCMEDRVDGRPEWVVREFIERMNAVHGDPERGRAAIALLAKPSRQNLEMRAQRTSAATGRQVAPEEMLAPSRFALRFTPKHYSSEVQGEYATVLIRGTSTTEQSEAHCVREDGHWRVLMQLPELPRLQKRGE
jgi:hypothetical protein